MGVKMNIFAAIMNIEQRNTALQSNIDVLQDLKTGLEQYIVNDELEAEAYESHKNYIQMMQIPVVNGLIMLCQTLIVANEKYKSVIGSSAPAALIDQDAWEKALSELIEQYNYLRSQVSALESETNYETGTETGQKYDSIFIIDSIHGEINLIYGLINDYKTKLQKLDEMISQLNGVYGQVSMLSGAVSNAINLLNSVPVNEEGYYVTCVMNMEPIKDLEDAMASNELTDELREEIGEDTYQALINGELSEEEVQEVLNIATGLGYEYITEHIGVPGRYEYYICPNITIYAETTCSAEFGTDLPASLEVSIEEDAEYLISTNASAGNFGFEVGFDGVAIDYTTQIDENSEYYIESSFNFFEVSVEYGVNSSIPNADGTGEITTTVATGATYTPSGNNGWQTETVTELAYADVPAPEVVVELQPVPAEVEPVEVNIPIYEPILNQEEKETLAVVSFVLFVITLVEPSPFVLPPIPAL